MVFILVGAPEFAFAQPPRSPHVIVAIVDSLPADGTVAVVRRFADARRKDVVFLAAGRRDDGALKLALAALRHHRFATPVPPRDVTFALKGARATAASTSAADIPAPTSGARAHGLIAGLDVGHARGRVRELADAALP